MTLDRVADPPAAVTDVAGAPAGWWARAGAFGIDVIFGLGAAVTVLLVGLADPRRGWLAWLSFVIAGLAVLAVAVNRWLLPVITGNSVGRSVLGIAVRDRAGGPVDPWRLLLRDLAHLLDTAPLFLGWLWPLVDGRGRTFADMLARTEVHRIEGPRPGRRRLTGALIAGAAALSVAAAAAGYLAIYRPQAAVAQARGQIAEQGPKLVADVLSYQAGSLDDDFARAQSLVTDGYRPTLVEQQDAIRAAGPADNDYWVSNSAVVSATGDRATMLLLLQGQRGAVPNQRFISASVQVDFVRSAVGRWQVSDLFVLKRPGGGGG